MTNSCWKKLKTSKHVRAVFLNMEGPEIEWILLSRTFYFHSLILIFGITARDIIVFAINFCIYSLRFFTVKALLFVNVPTSNLWWVVKVNVSWDNSGEKVTRVINVLYRVHVTTKDTIFRIYIAFNKLWMHMVQLLLCVVANRCRTKSNILPASQLQREEIIPEDGRLDM